MNKKNISMTLGGALASGLLTAAPAIQAGENPFAMTRIDQARQLAEAADKGAEGGSSGKMGEGKCGEAKCGADKKQATEAKCGAKMPEAGCSGKMPEGSCGNKK